MSALPSIEHPTGRDNFTIVTIGETDYVFSYRTIIGFRTWGSGGWILRENVWSSTTGRHLNYLSEDKRSRLSADEFARTLSAYLSLSESV